MRLALLIALVGGILVGVCLVIYTHALVAHKVVYTHWKFYLLSPVRELYREFVPQNKLAFHLSVSVHGNTTMTIYVLVSGPYLSAILRKYNELLSYATNTSIVLVPLDFNNTYARLSIAFSCVLSVNKTIAKNSTLVRELIHELEREPVDRVVNSVAPRCAELLNKTNIVVNSSRALLTAVETYGLLTYYELLPYRYYRDLGAPLYPNADLIYIVCNNARKICVATLSDKLEIVYRNVLTQVPFGYE